MGDVHGVVEVVGVGHARLARGFVVRRDSPVQGQIDILSAVARIDATRIHVVA